ncbi:MAG TPA: lipoprotein [Dokdonella sp.]|nr:lipoprotein [Dokdonella sp.]HUD43896.1 lipoprotein [Dokdonella sp.]
MRKSRLLVPVWLAIVLLGLVACGNKGDLVRPGQTPAAATP